MPVITIQSLKMTDEQKEVLAEKFIKTLSEVTNVPEDKIYMFFDEYELNQAAKAGQLFSKNAPKFGKGNF